MWTGQQTLESIDQALSQLRRQAQELDTQVQRSSTELVALRQREGERFRRLAEVRLDQLTHGNVVSGLDDADLRVKEILIERTEALADLQTQIERCEQRQTELEQSREGQRKQVAEAAERLDRAEAATQARLRDDDSYRAQLDKTGAAEAVAARAEEKTQQAEQDRIEKGKPYEQDPLFNYLWKRGFGTARYSANPLTRYLDQWVARLCNYYDARPNYAMLLEIPTRLGEHATRLRQTADAELQVLRAMEERAAADDGIPALREALSQAEEAMDRLDEQIREQENSYHELMGQRSVFAAGEDEYSRRSIDTLVMEFQRDNLPSLLQQAQATSTHEDDVLVRELMDVEAEQGEITRALDKHRAMHERALDRLKELEEVRYRFKRQRYDDVHSTFSNGDLLALILGEFLRGVATSGDLWGTIRRNQRYRRIESDPTFGSGGIGGMGRGTWHFPMPGGRGWGGGSRRGGFGGRGGGFRTGGGF